MNKRMKRKMQKQMDMADTASERMQKEVKGTATHVMAELKQQIVTRANQLEKQIEKQLGKVPVVGEAAAHKLAEMSDKLQDKAQARA